MEYKYEGHSFKSGIYKITNRINGRIYIGSAKRFIERWQSHTYSLRKQKHNNRFLQGDFNKCGEDAFVFEIVELTEDKSKEERLLIEEGYIKQYYDKGDKCYNLCEKAISRDGCKDKDPEETMKKRSRASKSQWENIDRREKHIKDMKIYWESEEGKQRLKTASESLKDRWVNDEDYKQKMLEIVRGPNNFMYGKYGSCHPSFGRKHSEETKYKQAIGRSQAIQQYTKDGVFIAEYYSVKEASKQTGIVYESIIQVANGKAKSAGGFVWIYKNPKKKAKISRKKRIFSPEEENKRIECLRQKAMKSVEQYTVDGEFIAKFSSVIEASLQTNTNASSLSSCLKGKYKSANGYVWRYAIR